MSVGNFFFYKATDSVKLQEYTFSELKKRVNKTSTSSTNTAEKAKKTDTPS